MQYFFVLIPIVIAIPAYFYISLTQRKARRAELIKKPLSEEYIGYINKNIPYYQKLPEELRHQLHGLINIFLEEKRFEGCGGQEITDEIRVTVAAQACVLLLNRPTNYYPKLHTILIYPQAYKQQEGQAGITLGESWQNGPVVLSWDNVKSGAEDVRDGRNVVFHEFSHRLDQEDGDADGAPILANSGKYTGWARVLGSEYQKMLRKCGKGRRTLMNEYGATNPAEFFAVATETFFEKPRQMSRKQPELYAELKDYYQLDPLSWE